MSEENTPSNPSKSSIKKWLFWGNVIVDIFIVIPLVWFFVVVPRVEIQSLDKGYVEHSYKDKKVSYKIVEKKPRKWVRLKDMNYTAIHAIVVSEDWAFYDHSGYDLGQIKAAIGDALSGDRARGASTISQQLVKNLFLSFDRSLYRKIKELVFATYMERNVRKEKILEIYLNIIEFGEGLYGIGNASQFYFKKSPKNLSPKEGAFLAMLLPNPKKYAESFRKKELTPFAQETIDKILKKMVVAKYLKKEQLDSQLKSTMKFSGKKKGVVKSKSKGKKRNPRKKVGKRKGLSDGSEYEQNAKVDQDLVLDDNPTFDEDAIIEDASGLEEEFNVE